MIIIIISPPDLHVALERFVSGETNKLFDENAEESMDKVCSDESLVDSLVEKWTAAYSQVTKNSYLLVV